MGVLYSMKELKRIRDTDYFISTEGEVWSNKNGKFKILKLAKASAGYLTVNLSFPGQTKNYYPHRLVAETFIPNPLKLERIRHKDQNRKNNSVENLEWY